MDKDRQIRLLVPPFLAEVEAEFASVLQAVVSTNQNSRRRFDVSDVPS